MSPERSRRVKGEQILAQAKAIANDDVRGATELTIAAAELLLEALEFGLVREVVQILVNAKPMMAPILNLSSLVLDDPKQAKASILAYKVGLMNAPAEAARETVTLLLEKVQMPIQVLTLSASTVIEQVILRLFHQQLVWRVVVAESRPRLEGRAMARRLAVAKLPVAVTYDAALPSLCTAQSVVLLGADAVLTDAFVNKAGSFALCLAAREVSALCVVTTTSHKILLPRAQEWFRVPASPARTTLVSKKPDFLDQQFDCVPLRLVDALVTETGSTFGRQP